MTGDSNSFDSCQISTLRLDATTTKSLGYQTGD